MNFHGYGPVHGFTTDLSSARGELAGLTAITIVAHLLLKYFSSSANVNLVFDNKGMVQKYDSLYTDRFCHHHEKTWTSL